jgi:hypothetical protein
LFEALGCANKLTLQRCAPCAPPFPPTLLRRRVVQADHVSPSSLCASFRGSGSRRWVCKRMNRHPPASRPPEGDDSFPSGNQAPLCTLILRVKIELILDSYIHAYTRICTHRHAYTRIYSICLPMHIASNLQSPTFNLPTSNPTSNNLQLPTFQPSSLQPPTSAPHPPASRLQPLAFRHQPTTSNLQPPTSSLHPPASHL